MSTAQQGLGPEQARSARHKGSGAPLLPFLVEHGKGLRPKLDKLIEEELEDSDRESERESERGGLVVPGERDNVGLSPNAYILSHLAYGRDTSPPEEGVTPRLMVARRVAASEREDPFLQLQVGLVERCLGLWSTTGHLSLLWRRNPRTGS